MSNSVDRRRRTPLSAEVWAQHVNDWQKSGLSIRAYAAQHDLGESNLRKRQRQHLLESAPASSREGRSHSSKKRLVPHFVPVQLPEAAAAGDHGHAEGVIELGLGNGRVVRLRGSVDPDALAVVLRVIEQA